jgi:hypothetical protein
LVFRQYEVLSDGPTITDLSEDDAKAVDILEMLGDTVDAIPPSLIKEAEALREVKPDLFEKTLMHGVQTVGFGFFPTSATDFLEVLNRTVQRDMAAAG